MLFEHFDVEKKFKSEFTEGESLFIFTHSLKPI